MLSRLQWEVGQVQWSTCVVHDDTFAFGYRSYNWQCDRDENITHRTRIFEGAYNYYSRPTSVAETDTSKDCWADVVNKPARRFMPI